MAGIDTEKTEKFSEHCNRTSNRLLEMIDDMQRLYTSMALDAAPSPGVNFDKAVGAADDIGDVGYIAHILVLDATGADNIELGEYQVDDSNLDDVETTIATADNMIDGGDEARELRDKRNASVTVEALVAALNADADIDVTDDGLIVATGQSGLPIDLPVGPDLKVPITGRGGTTYGNVFIVGEGEDVELDARDRPVGTEAADLLEHEKVHTYQWAAAGWGFATQYLKESIREHKPDVDIKIEKKKGPWGIPYPDIDLDVEKPPAGGCGNRFEQHADLDDGGYGGCSTEQYDSHGYEPQHVNNTAPAAFAPPTLGESRLDTPPPNTTSLGEPTDVDFETTTMPHAAPGDTVTIPTGTVPVATVD